jgi:hypothetical protein
MSFKTTDKDLKVGDLVRVWSHILYQDHYKKVSELAVVSRYYCSNVASSRYWLFYNHKGEFSCELHRVELVS